MYSSPYGYGYNNGFSSLQTASVFSAIGLIAGIICAIVLYIVFLKKSNDGKFTGFVGWMYEFLNFQKLSIEAILKIVYIILAVWITFTSFGLISGGGFLAFITFLIFGNIILRIAFEFSMLTVKICKNTIEINKKMTIINKKLSAAGEPVVNDEPFVKAEATEEENVAPVEENIPEPEEDSSDACVCPNCGAEVTEGNAFCGKCGTKL